MGFDNVSDFRVTMFLAPKKLYHFIDFIFLEKIYTVNWSLIKITTFLSNFILSSINIFKLIWVWKLGSLPDVIIDVVLDIILYFIIVVIFEVIYYFILGVWYFTKFTYKQIYHGKEELQK